MQIMSTKKRDPLFQEFENGSHIARKTRAAEREAKPRNFKQAIEEFSEDDDGEDLTKYIRYIK